jgi:hypothetical protein
MSHPKSLFREELRVVDRPTAATRRPASASKRRGSLGVCIAMLLGLIVGVAARPAADFVQAKLDQVRADANATSQVQEPQRPLRLGLHRVDQGQY